MVAPTIARTVQDPQKAVVDCGAVMVAGSHIQADGNELKFYNTTCKVARANETAIRATPGAARMRPCAMSLTRCRADSYVTFDTWAVDGHSAKKAQGQGTVGTPGAIVSTDGDANFLFF
ncbi:hypothetical protein [Gemmobacter sp. 24YEA27]|uniref:hypothetical protein n=1 Tax=Gemmobacter sp. 24YEA27 TaxID=3040672 RepID=UPI0024B38F38|nr:hypothetical protein [Gemmobacter sp. 24YEA27]